MDLSYLKNYIYEAPRETFEPSYQEKSDVYKPKGNKVYEHIKKEIDSRSKKVKSSDKNSNTYQVNSLYIASLYFTILLTRVSLLMRTGMLPLLLETETSRMMFRTRRGEKSSKKIKYKKFWNFILFTQKVGGSRQ